MIKVLIVDDHAIVREGLKLILADAPEIIVGGEACNGEEALAKVRGEHWDAVILDLSLPDTNGIEVLRHIKSQPTSPPVLIFTMHAEEHYAPRILRMGASGYLTKSSPPDEVITALRKVAHGGKYIGMALAEQLAYDAGAVDEKPLHTALSDREFQVLCLLVSGRTSTQIADELCVSIKTISTHRSRILEKMHMKSNAELVQYAVRHQLLPSDPETHSP